MATGEVKWGIVPPMRVDRILDRSWLGEMAEVVELCGCESVWVPEHVVVAEATASRYPYNGDGRMPLSPGTVMPDPLQLLGHLAALTSTVRLATSVLVLPQHSPAILAKRVASLDVFSGGRVLLGVGVGWQAEEYAACGVPFAERGARMEECMEAMRALWAPGAATYAGRFVAFDQVHSDPKPVQPGGVPFVIGGSSVVAARRAGRMAEGFYPLAVSPEGFAACVAEMTQAAAAAGRDPGAVEVTAWPGSWARDRPLDAELAAAYVAAGAHRLILRTDAAGPDPEDLERYLRRYRGEVLERLP